MNTNQIHNDQIRTARIAGIWYLLLGISGILGFMVFHSQIFVADPQQTLKNLVDLESTARIRILLEFVVVTSQALAAVYFYKLFKGINDWAAWTLGIWGTVNSVAIMVSAMAMATALSMANSTLHTLEEQVLLVHLMQTVSSHAWSVGGLFFGLWLLPMGYIVIRSKRMPIWLGRVVIIGGIGYLVNTLIYYMGIDFEYNTLLVIPATIGEFWMIGYLLIFGIRPARNLD